MGPRVGTFFVGAFAGSAATVFPRLAVFLGAPTNRASAAVEMDVLFTSGVEAVDIKRMSGNSVDPTLVPAK
jgi:hypothetical protein